MTRRSLLFTLVLGLFLTVASSALADPMIHTGDAVRTKSWGLLTVKVYSIRHDMKEKPATKSKQAMIDADVDKKFTCVMLRDVDSKKIQNALRDAFKMNGFTDGGRIEQFVGAFNKEEMKEKSSWVISYNAAAKSVTIWVQGAGSATIAGQDFMKAVWSIWFGKIDQPSIGDHLMSRI
jgi:hypothetical protein